MMAFCKENRFLVPVLVLAACLVPAGCGPDKKPVKTTLPPQASAPTVTAPKPGDVKSTTPAEGLASSNTPKPDEVDNLIVRVEKEYQTGQNNYVAGHLEAAKTNFDNAVNILWQGPLEVKSDERLEREFSKIVEGVHEVEMAALRQGDGFTEQRSEPAPIDAINDVTFPSDPAIRAKAAEELKSTVSDLPLVINDYVAGYINLFSTRDRATLSNALIRAGRYRSMIERVFREEGVPQDLIYLAQAESGFHALALSRVGARGMWQFMSYSMGGFGLKKSWWIDERQDPEKSTRAAAKFLKTLYQQFGDWYLAMAAYNSGAGTIQRGVQRTGYADFWELYKRDVLPRETKNYVPIIIAMAIMGKNPTQYGLEGLQPELPPEVDRVKIDYPVDLRLVAEIIDTPVEDLLKLNPALLRLTTPKNEKFDLVLPTGTKGKFEQMIAQIPPDNRVSWRFHKIATGESLTTIARKYRTTPTAIAEVNGFETGDALKAGSKLVIPVSARNVQGEAANGYAKTGVRYKVRKGDTVFSVADQFSVPPEQVRRWNRLKGNGLRPGRLLTIHRPLGPKAPPMSGETAPRSSRGRSTKSSAQRSAAHNSKAKHGPGETQKPKAVHSKSQGSEDEKHIAQKK